MAKPITLKQARKMLQEAGCKASREREHQIWIRPQDGRTFSLPGAKRQISAGVVRQLKWFIKGDINYSKRGG